MQASPTEYINSKGWEHRQQSGQLVLKTCPICGDEKWHFYMSPEDPGPWFCHKCQEKGNLHTLQKRFGESEDKSFRGDIAQKVRPAFKKTDFKEPDQSLPERYHQALLKDPGALEYLRSRWISQETAARFRLGLCHDNGTRWLSIPHFQKGRLLNIKFRSMPPAERTFKRVAGCRSVLFNSDCLTEKHEIFITEGELDAITLVQAGIENVVSGTTGAGNFEADWIDQLQKIKRIYLLYDPDEAGQKGARALAKRLGYSRCFNVEMPGGMDVNEFFSGGCDLVDFKNLLKSEVRPLDLPGVISFSTGLEILQRDVSQGKAANGIQTPWSTVNRLIKAFRYGDLIILSAPPKTGKTSWALDICRHLAFENNIPALFYCLEMRPERLIEKLIQAQFKTEMISSENLTQAKKSFSGCPLYLAHDFKKQKLDDVLGLIRQAIQRYDLKFVVFDNLHFLIRSVSSVNEELGQAVQGFKLLAEEMEIPIMAIAQPRKRESASRDEIMSAEDIKYSNAIHADCDQMIILYRKRVASKAKEINGPVFSAKTESLDPVTLVRVEAHRYGAGGETLLYFHGAYSRFDPLEVSR